MDFRPIRMFCLHRRGATVLYKGIWNSAVTPVPISFLCAQYAKVAADIFMGNCKKASEGILIAWKNFCISKTREERREDNKGFPNSKLELADRPCHDLRRLFSPFEVFFEWSKILPSRFPSRVIARALKSRNNFFLD